MQRVSSYVSPFARAPAHQIAPQQNHVVYFASEVLDLLCPLCRP